ncbi:MAG: class II glutamine amidotransferase [Methylocystaceae bacterium]|nr:class II glutamine amidotransferase [Methylocystaceae bacterium]
MCRWLAYNGHPVFLDSLLFDAEHSLIEQSLHARKAVTTINGDGFGVAWYGEREKPGLFRDILPAWNDSNLKSIAHQIKSGLFFAHVRASTGTPISRENCHPFAYKNWVFMHNGQIGEYHKVRHDLEMTLSDDLFPSRLGSTDSELILLLMVMHGLEENPLKAIQKTIAQILNVMQKHDVKEALRFTACLSSGTETIAIRFANDEHAPSLYTCHQDHAILVASEPLNDAGLDWCSLGQGMYLYIKDGASQQLRFKI